MKIVLAALAGVAASVGIKTQAQTGYHSSDWSDSISISFENISGDDVQLFWYDYSGNLQPYATLHNGETYTQQTYATHPWGAQGVNGNGEHFTINAEDVLVPDGLDDGHTFEIQNATSATLHHETGGMCMDTDNGASDPWGDVCADYAIHTYWCGGWYDDDDFFADSMCCACGGGVTPETEAPETHGHGDGMCHDTENGALDTAHDTCADYTDHPEWCDHVGAWDDDDFVAADMCCACGGGDTARECEANDLAHDDYGDTCLEYAHHLHWCGNYDTATFHSNEMCCACIDIL